MANKEHLKKLSEGNEVWNEWRKKNNIHVDLSNANLSNRDLSNFHLDNTDLSGSILSCADLSCANLLKSNLESADLCGTNLSFATAVSVNFYSSNLTDVVAEGTNFSGSNFSYSKLTNAKLSNTHLLRTIFFETDCTGTDFTDSTLGNTLLISTDLSKAFGIDSLVVSSECPIDFRTLKESDLPNSFLIKLGLPENYIEYLPDFFESSPIKLYPTFLSHSSIDKEFARKLYDALIYRGVQVWFDEKKIKPGDHLEEKISEGINLYDKTILICSEASLNSWWVERELSRVFDKEKERFESSSKKTHILIPIKINKYIHKWDNHRKSDITRYNIGDFTEWRSEEAFKIQLEELIIALNVNRLESKPPTYL